MPGQLVQSVYLENGGMMNFCVLARRQPVKSLLGVFAKGSLSVEFTGELEELGSGLGDFVYLATQMIIVQYLGNNLKNFING